MASAPACRPAVAVSCSCGAGPRDASGFRPSLDAAAHPLVTLRKRAEFLAVRGGARWAGAAFVLEAKARRTTDGPAGPRFGFTVTKRLGVAVVRNRIRRRLREALRTGGMAGAKAGFDYVIIARQAALRRPFTALVGDFRQALAKVHRQTGSATG